ncbi:MAG: outer membrane lipoprotein carrier protein LolA, partial [Firmicutes bacterium]|nr:outer membrane lipoprotein carrier protein LolA [Bacillota bacterium]
PSPKEVVERFDAAQSKVTSLQAPFTLTIRRALLKTPTVTKGTLYLQGSEFVHFAFAPPEDLILHLTQKELLSYSPGANEGERLKIGLIRNHDRRFLGLGQKLSELSDYFNLAVTADPDHAGALYATLTPRSYSLKKRFRMIRLSVDTSTYLPRQVLWVEKSGDAWTLDLGALQINQALPASARLFKVPDGVPMRSAFSFFATRKTK